MKTKKIIPIALALTLTSCGASPIVEPKVGKKVKNIDSVREFNVENLVSDEFHAALDSFADKTVDVLYTAGNVNYSPLSLYYALSVAELGGADDAALLELLGVESFDGISTSKQLYGDEIDINVPSGSSAALADQCSKLWRQLCLTGEYTDIDIANSIWSDAGISKDFASSAAENFYAECFDSLSGEDMGNWIKEKTRGTLAPKIEIEDLQDLSILNTVYFRAEWTDKFKSSRTENGVFHSPNGDVDAKFMQSTEIKSFMRGEDFTVASRSFKDGGEMTVVLPDEGVDIREILERDGLLGLLEGGESKCGDVIWYFPKFEFDFEFSAKDMLCELGFDEFFTENSGMAKNITDADTTVSDIKQGTHIAVDENGVTASSYTDIVYCGTPMPEDTADMRMDRPFLYTVSYKDVILFVGIVDEPSV